MILDIFDLRNIAKYILKIDKIKSKKPEQTSELNVFPNEKKLYPSFVELKEILEYNIHRLNLYVFTFATVRYGTVLEIIDTIAKKREI